MKTTNSLYLLYVRLSKLSKRTKLQIFTQMYAIRIELDMNGYSKLTACDLQLTAPNFVPSCDI